MAEERNVETRIGELLDHLGKEVGKNKVKIFSEQLERSPYLSTGLPSLDAALNGGIGLGTIIETYGEPGSGKTNLCLGILGTQCKIGRVVLIEDAENKLDPTLANALGVDLTRYPLGQPETLEECFEVIDASCDKLGPGDCILVDSAPALIPKAELEAGIGHQSYGGNSKAMSDGLNKVRFKICQRGVVLIFINQVRTKLNVMWGDPTETPCGKALKHACAIRMEVKKKQTIKEGDKAVGQEVEVKIVKSNRSFPYQIIPLKLYFGKGFSKEHSLLELAKSQNIIEGSGAWLKYGDSKFHGEAEVIKYLSTDEGYDEILSKLKI